MSTTAAEAAKRTAPEDTDDAAEVLDLPAYVPYLLAAAYNKMSAASSRVYLRHFGIGVIDWRVLSMLALEPAIRAARICQVIGLDKAAVSRSLGGLEARGLVAARAAGGRGRQRLLTLTSAGVALQAAVCRMAKAREKRLLAGFSEEERRQLLTLLGRLHANIAALDD